jgi:hypothetical protein
MRQVLVGRHRRRMSDRWAPQAEDGLSLDPRDLDIVRAKDLRRRIASDESRRGPDQLCDPQR